MNRSRMGFPRMFFKRSERKREILFRPAHGEPLDRMSGNSYVHRERQHHLPPIFRMQGRGFLS